MRIRIGSAQESALEIYVYDPAFDDEPAPGEVRDRALIYDAVDREALAYRLTEAANSADADRDAVLCRALSALSARVRRS